MATMLRFGPVTRERAHEIASWLKRRYLPGMHPLDIIVVSDWVGAIEPAYRVDYMPGPGDAAERVIGYFEAQGMLEPMRLFTGMARCPYCRYHLHPPLVAATEKEA